MKCGKRTVPIVLPILLLLAGILAGIFLRTRSEQTFYPVRGAQKTLVIDAGHGGPDGGAVSERGTEESELNLSIAKKLDCLAGLYGIPAVMTRTEDTALGDDGTGTLRQRKRTDLEQRVALIEGTENAQVISIHQNIFPNGTPWGTQVFYRDEDSRLWAEQTQALVRAVLQPENGRTAVQIPDTVYLMRHIHCPALLVECGFLSNEQEERKLTDSGYQTKLAAVLLSSWLTKTENGMEHTAR